jgi:NDP-sugar pyrophosphorylase family protein
VRAKAALPVGDQAIVQRILRWLASDGVTDAVLNLHHLPHTITSLVGDGSADGVRVRYSWENPVLGSAGGPRRALPLLGTSTFLIVNGDTLTTVTVSALLEAHKKSGALVTLAVIANAEPAKYGGVVVESDGAVSGFATASRLERLQLRDTFHFLGVQIVEAEVFAALSDDVPSESVKQVYPALIAARPGSVRALVTDAEFFDIGTAADYLTTYLHFQPGGSRLQAPGVRLEECVVWDDVEASADVRLRRCIIADGVRLPSGAAWENMTIRVARGELMATERLIGELAVGPIDGTTRA